MKHKPSLDDSMWQALTTGPGAISLRRVGRPQAGPHQLLVRVRRMGICGSDLHVYEGRHPDTTYPIVQGHEVAGIVEAPGAATDGFATGDLIALRPQVTCGTCRLCRSDREQICERLRVMGFLAPGGGQEWIAIDPWNAIRLPATTTLDEAVLVEPVAVAVHALRRGGKPAAQVLVLGAGPIGNLVGQVSVAHGATVAITDVSEEKLAIAHRAGIQYAFNAAVGDLKSNVDSVFPDGADIIFECVGSPTTFTQAIDLAARGSRIVVVGVFGAPVTSQVGLIQNRELTIIGSLMYRREDFDDAVELIASQDLALSELISHRHPLAEIAAAYESIERSRDGVMKSVITLDP